MVTDDKKIVKVGSRLSKFIGTKAPREKKLQAASMQAEFTLRDTLIMLCYLGRDPDREIAEQARKNLIPAARNWHSRPDRPDLPEPVLHIITKVLERVGLGEGVGGDSEHERTVEGNIGLFGLGEIIQAVDHNNRTATIQLTNADEEVKIYTESGKVVGAVCGDIDGMKALHHAFGWSVADFSYFLAPPGPFENRLKVNTLNLVMDALEFAPDDDPFDSDLSHSWQVQGHLRVLNIFEIAEIFEMNSKQCICTLESDGQSGNLYFNHGRVVNAALGEMDGMEAACHLLAWPAARFVVKRGGEGVSEEIHVGMQNLIIEAMRLLDEGVTVTERIQNELQKINELFEGQDVYTLPVLDKVRLVFGDDEQAREALEVDSNILVRKAIKVKISKTVHKYLSKATEREKRLQASEGRVPLSTTEKLVLLSYLSHDEDQEIKDKAKHTLNSLDEPTYRKAFGADLHPSVIDFLVRETVRDESVIRVVCGAESLMEETALHILKTWPTEPIIQALIANTKALEKNPDVGARLAELVADKPDLKKSLDAFEQSLLDGNGTVKIEGPLSFCGLAGLVRAAKHGSRSGTVVVEGKAGTGHVYFNKGKVVGVIFGDLKGMPALQAIVAQTDLRFRYLLRTYFHTENVEPSKADELLESGAGHPVVDKDFKSGMRVITGHPEGMDIYEVLSSLEGTPVPVCLTVVCEEGSGEIVRDKSRILRVHVDGKPEPFKAMAAILSWEGTKFVIRHELGTIASNTDKTLADFFTEAVKELPEEMRRIPRPGELPEWELSEAEYQSLYNQILNMGVAEKIKLALMGNKEARDILVRDPNKLVSVAVVKSPKIQESEIESIAKSKSVGEDVLREIFRHKAWMKSYKVKLNMVSNSKTPLPLAMKLLTQIRDYDLKKLSKSKEISSVVANQAKRMMEAKGLK